jgi:hypothetical protein
LRGDPAHGRVLLCTDATVEAVAVTIVEVHCGQAASEPFDRVETERPVLHPRHVVSGMSVAALLTSVDVLCSNPLGLPVTPNVGWNGSLQVDGSFKRVLKNAHAFPTDIKLSAILSMR